METVEKEKEGCRGRCGNVAEGLAPVKRSRNVPERAGPCAVQELCGGISGGMLRRVEQTCKSRLLNFQAFCESADIMLVA